MINRRINSIKAISIIVILAALVNVGAALAQDNARPSVDEDTTRVKTRSASVPNLISPTGTISDTTPTYKWNKVTSATNYQIQVYKGSTKVLDKTVGSSVCVGSICKTTPSITLATAAHKWRARAKVGGIWKAWSAYMNFTVAASSGFNSQFNGSMAGWQKIAGATWSVTSTAMVCPGLAYPDYSNVHYKNSQYSNFDMSAGVKSDISFFTYFMVVRSGISAGTDNQWYPAYLFGYSSDGFYKIFKVDSSQTITDIQPWSESTAISPEGWNTLRVVTNGSTFKFYINGTLLKTFSDSMKSKGYVGFQVRGIETGKKFQVDWAKLTVLTSATEE